MKLAPIADRVAAELFAETTDPWHTDEGIIRDRADFASDCELSTFGLDVLCGMIHRRLKRMPVALIGKNPTAADVRAVMAKGRTA